MDVKEFFSLIVVENHKEGLWRPQFLSPALAQQFSLSLVGPSHPVVVPLRVAQAGRRGFSDPRSFLPFSLSAACLKFCQTHVTTLLQEWPAFRFRAAPPGDDRR
jgi:hypothetical protein